MDAGYAEAGGGELGGLVVHEGDEGRDDEGGASAGDGGELVAEALAGSGGHDEEDVAAFGGGSADGLLIGAEGGEAEGLMEEVGEVHELAYVRILFASGVPTCSSGCGWRTMGSTPAELCVPIGERLLTRMVRALTRNGGVANRERCRSDRPIAFL